MSWIYGIKGSTRWIKLPGRISLSGFVCLAFSCRLMATACVSAPTGLTSWWAADGNAGDIAGINNGVLQGGATASGAGMVGSAFVFDGTNAYVQVPDSPSQRPTNLTVAAWVQFSGLDSPGTTADLGQQYIVFKQNSRSGDFEGYDLGKARVAGGDVFSLRVSSASGVMVELYSQTTITTGVWYHIAGVRGPNVIQLYVNGVLEGETAVANAQDYGTQPLYFGSSGQSFWDRKLMGLLDEVTLYSRALSSNEIAALFAAGSAGMCKAPSISVQPQNQTVVAGNGALFAVTATGFETLGYAWRFNGTNILGATNSSLTLNSVHSTNAGTYTVVVTNSLGSATSLAAVLTVLLPPTIASQPLSRTNECTSAAIFTVGANGTPPLGYQWYFNGNLISLATSSSLTFSNVHASEQGAYFVVVTNAAGGVTSTPNAILTVVDTTPPSVTLLGPNPLTNECHTLFLDPGATAHDTCAGAVPVITNSAVNPNAAGIYTIKYVGTDSSGNSATNIRTVYILDRIPPSVILNGSNPLTNEIYAPFLDPGATASDGCAGSLPVATDSNVNPNVAGVYMVKYSATDPSGNSATNTRTVYVVQTSVSAPIIILQPQSQTNVVGTPAEFTVTATGLAPLYYQWELNGVAVAGATNSTLSFDAVQVTNGGAYQAVVTNAAGSVTSRVASLTVWVPPIISLQPQGASNVVGTAVSFSVTATGVPAPAYQWRLNEDDIPGATNAALSIGYVVGAPCHPGVSRSYSVVVSNAAGVVTGGPAVLTVIELAAGSTVSIPDPRLEAAIRSTLSKPTGPLWVSNLWGLVSLTAAGQHITNLSGLEYATNLVSLQLPRNGITDLTPLGCMGKLVHLGLDHNRIADASAVAALLTLTNLDLSENLLADGTPLSTLSSLRALALDGNSLSDLSFVSSLPQLTRLSMSRNDLQDLRPLTNLWNLNSLALGRNLEISNFWPLSRLTNVTRLVLRESFFEQTYLLRGLTNLVDLDLENAYRLKSVASLTNLSNLSRLNLSWSSSITDCAVLREVRSLTNLYLRGIALTNASFVTNLYRLSVLNLDSTRLVDAAPVQRLTNLTYLSMTANPGMSNLAAISNLPGLTGLELRANSISNAAFLAGLRQIKYLDLGYNKVTDVLPLTSLTNVESLVLAGNPTSAYATLAGNGALSNLWLYDSAISDLSFLSQLKRLNYLNLERNALTNITALTGMTNLNGLGLSWNPIDDYGPVAGLGKLASIRVDGNEIGNVSFVTNLTNLTFLSLCHNRISDLSPLAGLSQLNDLYLVRNRIAEIDQVAALPYLLNVDLRLNFLDLTDTSPAGTVVQGLVAEGVQVSTRPQNELPQVVLPFSKWYIPANATSAVPVLVWEDSVSDNRDLVVTASSSDSNLVLVATSPLVGSNVSRTLSVISGAGAGQSAQVTISVTDDVLASFSTNLQVGVVEDVAVSNLCPNLDPVVAAAIAFVSQKAPGDLTTVDLLMLSSLSLQDADTSDHCIWQWITNVTSLYLSGSTVTNVTFLTNLWQLSTLSIASSSPADFSPLASLTNLSDLSLYGGFITNLDFLTNLAGLRTLTAYKTHVTDLSPLTALSKLESVRFRQNRLTNVSAIADLPQLVHADISLNLLDLTPTSTAMMAIQAAVDRGATVDYLPTRSAPVIDLNSNWVVAANAPSWLYFKVSDNAEFADLDISAFASDTNLLADVTADAELTAFGIDRFVRFRSGSNQGSTTVGLTVTNDAGLVTNRTVSVIVEQPLPLAGVTFSDTHLSSWTTSTNAAWFGQTAVSHLGALAAQRGSITNNGDSWMRTTVTGPGLLSFWWKVSSETNYDFLRFSVGTNLLNEISGEVEWEQVAYSFPPGTYSLMWNYSKDTDTGHGMDAGWVSEISFVPISWLQVGGNPSSGQVQLSVYGEAGKTYDVWYSTNLVSWLPLGSVFMTNSVATFVDSSAGPGARYYRLQ